MLDSFVAWLDDYLIGKHPSVVVRSIVGLLAFASLLGVIIGNTAVRLGILLAALLLILAAALILLADRRTLQQTSDRYQRLLARYCEFINADPQPTILIKHWDQHVAVDSKGDTHEFVTIKAVSLRENLYFVTLRIGPSWSQPKKYRDKVKVDIRSLLIDGNTGTSWDVTSSWLHDGRINIVAHLHDPVKRDSEMTIRMERTWPGKCLPLMMNHQPDEFILRFNEAMPIEAARYIVVLPAGADAHYEPIGFAQSDAGFGLEAGTDAENRRTFTLTTASFDSNRRVGMRLELKRK
ncbi:hypothetical protein [Fodinicola acaciae]|uniref:hypothetical protein n=1 Tax=Fodinicola acaciae TaxID=2681555 RepID=UPI0013D82083|nr:hypothetical protein [Fodinicola acaciae]